jgi:hypothetical protein
MALSNEQQEILDALLEIQERSRAELRNEFNQALSGLAARLTKELAPANAEQAPTPSDKLSLKQLQAQIDALNTTLQEQRTRTAEALKRAALAPIAERTIDPEAFNTLFNAKYPLKVDDATGTVYYEGADGSIRSLEELSTEFFASTGKLLLRPDTVTTGQAEAPVTGEPTEPTERELLDSFLSQFLK